MKKEDGVTSLGSFGPGTEPENGFSIGGSLPMFPHPGQEEEETEVAVVVAAIREHIGKTR